MAGVWNELFRQDFVNSDSIVIEHNLDREFIDVRVIIDAEFQNELLSRFVYDCNDPTNKLAVKLRSVQTGTIQILSRDATGGGMLSASQLAALGICDTFVLGDEYAYTEDLTASTTTSETFVQKLRLSVTGIPAGTYHIAASFTWNLDSTSDDFLAQLEVDDTTQIWNMQAEPKDSGTDQEYYGYGLAHVELAAGSHDVDLDFATSDSAETARIDQARIEFWRIS